MILPPSLVGKLVTLRPLSLLDCTDRYVEWLQDPKVNRYLETRWQEQTPETVRAFVQAATRDMTSMLLAIVEQATNRHVGNIKLGPINSNHSCADLSYFIGETDAWGKGYASEAIRLLSDYALGPLQLHRVQAGVYSTNVGSCKALQKAGFQEDGRWTAQLKGQDGWEDHLWYYRLAK